MPKNVLKVVLLLSGFLVLQACSVKKFIPEDELLYTGADLKLQTEEEIENRKALQSELEALLMPSPNSKFLGSRIGLYFHYKAQQENPGFINRFLNKQLGQEPVYLSDADPFQTEDLLKNRLENRGYFYSRVSHSVQENDSEKTANITYNAVLPANPYILAQYQMESDSIQLYRAIENSFSESLLKENEPFNLSVMKAERERIDNYLKARGYYNFSPNFLIFEADTNQYDRKKFDLFLRLKEDVPNAGVKPYIIEHVNIYPNYSVDTDSVARDTTRFNNRNYIQNEVFFEPEKLDPFVLLEEGELYNPQKSGRTSRRLTSIGAYKFVNIRYDEIDSLSTDSLGYLEANIFLSPMNKRAIRLELQAVTKSNNFAGPHLAVTYTNRNLFEGGEILSLSAKAGYETQLSSESGSGQTSIVLGVDSDLIFPRMLFPIFEIKSNWFQYSIPKTKIGLGFEYLDRSNLFSLFSVNGSFGYLWKANRFVTHELNPFSVTYTQLSQKTAEFEDILKSNPFLKSSFDQQFIAGLTYSFIYNEMIDELDRHQFFVNANIDVAGNILDMLSSGEPPRKFLGLTYAQYAKFDTDLRYHFKLSPEHVIATRLFGGIGLPYGNSEVMPFSRQFYSGGPYSVRAFQIRSLGPGSYSPPAAEDGIPYYDRMGNIRLEANVEYRFPLYQFLKGAVFADAGNVWNTESNYAPVDDEQEEDLTPAQIEQQRLLLEKGTFGSDFLDEMAVGVGAGLRIDIQSFVIRFDLGIPVHTPYFEEGQRWEFRLKDPVFNFAIGYPF
ncbi:translocation and assembly module lipoprotein TamL [Salinimicrobium oceani]|uniref:BamA/TamA family outer membrane protein n=1 Tax=Salinimicrobium oceani TaxID=2722702 RepID=A0ABX1D2D7_9FLAO|nr:BamA/TamA family outer membrane protein [Salinimicrobium oceani]NJW53349.1 BamA/TamA family outer membrane protein [Salinimicrobium oceani]